ncbi:MAG TPA: PilZ domain-containing protein [Kofleriaceae bacterium]|nr:PilZ domain-containing protein [Kofleriaceae bacterium]
MEPSDRRIGMRIDLELFLNEYVRDRPYRVLAANLSETGLYFHRVSPDPAARLVPQGTPVGLELELPETGEVIWARGEICREAWGKTLRGTGVRFADMPRCHARLVREFCQQKRRDRLDALLERIRKPRAVPLPRRRPLA